MFPETTVTGKGQNLRVQHGDDSGLWVEFYYNKVHEKPFVKIRVPGDNKTEWDHPVKEKEKVRWAKQWEAFQQQRSQFGNATMLEQWGVLSDDQIRNLKAFNVQTVEQLASVNDGVISKMGPGARELVRKANAWIEGSAAQAKEEALQKALAVADDKLAAQALQLQQMQEQLQQLMQAAPAEAKQKRKYTRKETA